MRKVIKCPRAKIYDKLKMSTKHRGNGLNQNIKNNFCKLQLSFLCGCKSLISTNFEHFYLTIFIMWPENSKIHRERAYNSDIHRLWTFGFINLYNVVTI